MPKKTAKKRMGRKPLPPGKGKDYQLGPVRIDARTHAAVDDATRRQGVPRAQLMRRIIEDALFGAPAGLPRSKAELMVVAGEVITRLQEHDKELDKAVKALRRELAVEDPWALARAALIRIARGE